MNKHPFDLLMELEPHQIRLDCAALHVARDIFPGLNVSRYLRTLDLLAEDIADHRPGLSANLRYEAMRSVLVDQYGLTGNRERYYDAENCYLNRVLDRGTGIPISLSIVWIEIARRLKWPVSGVALPGHFIIRFDDADRYVLVDPFHDGQPLSIDDCKGLVKRRFGSRFAFQRRFLKPVRSRGILGRLLRNLRNVYLMDDDHDRLVYVLERMTAIEPRNSRHHRDLAAAYCRRGDVRTACAYLEGFLRHKPRGEESRQVRDSLRQLRAALVAMN
jgi:regulator of sirC expression with transglutaminase-like and TPR domain